MEHAFGLDIPRTLDEVCDPRRLALLVYDMQVGVVSQLSDGADVTRRVAALLQTARDAGVRTFFTRHMWLPLEVAGVAQLRTAMAWQRVNRVADLTPSLQRDSAGFQIVPELTPRASEAVFDKITMSAFEGTPLDIALRDCGIVAFAIVGVALEIGSSQPCATPRTWATSRSSWRTRAGRATRWRPRGPSPPSRSPAGRCKPTARRWSPRSAANATPDRRPTHRRIACPGSPNTPRGYTRIQRSRYARETP